MDNLVTAESLASPSGKLPGNIEVEGFEHAGHALRLYHITGS
jgi:hypothetical protein